VLRHLLKTKMDYELYLSAMKSVVGIGPRPIIEMVRRCKFKDRNDTLSDKIIALEPGEDYYGSIHPNFISGYAKELVLKEMEHATLDELHHLACFGGSFGAAALQELMRELMLKGGTFRVRKLTEDNEQMLCVPKLRQVTFSRSFDEIGGAMSNDDNVLLYPTNPNFPAIDALAKFSGEESDPQHPQEFFALQATTSTRHPINRDGIENVLNAVKQYGGKSDGKLKLYFVGVNLDHFRTMKVQKIGGKGKKAGDKKLLDQIEQWVFLFDKNSVHNP